MILSVEQRAELVAYRQEFEKELHRILGYWMRYAPDPESGGFHGGINLENRVVPDAPRSSVLTARILWTFAAAERAFPDRGYRELADRAWTILETRFRDPDHDGYYLLLDAGSQVLDATKHTYAQAFVLYAFSMYYGMCSDSQVLQRIRDFFPFLMQQAAHPQTGGYQEGFSRDWKPLYENRMADDNEPYSMNTHLHLLESLAAVYQVWPDSAVHERLHQLCLLFRDRIIRPDGHLGVFFDQRFTETADSAAICSFGHEVEASWLIYEACESLGDRMLLDELEPRLIDMARNVFRLGVDQDGGLFLESRRFGSHLRTNKHWWLQAELLVGEMQAFQLTGTPAYWKLLKRTWRFIEKNVMDHRGGEWFTKVNRLGKPYLVEPPDDPSPYYRNDWKIDPWKCPYHNGRAMLELIGRIDYLLK